MGRQLSQIKRAELTVCSPNKPKLKFSILQISKHHSQVKRKNSRSSNLEVSALYTVDISWLTSDEPQEKGQKAKQQEEPAWSFSPYAAEPPRHRQNSQDKHSTKFIQIPYGSFTGSHKVCHQRVCPDILNLILLSVQPEGKQVQGGLWPMALAETPQFKELMPSIVSPECQLGSGYRPTFKPQLHKLLKGAVLECATKKWS